MKWMICRIVRLLESQPLLAPASAVTRDAPKRQRRTTAPFSTAASPESSVCLFFYTLCMQTQFAFKFNTKFICCLFVIHTRALAKGQCVGGSVVGWLNLPLHLPTATALRKSSPSHCSAISQVFYNGFPVASREVDGGQDTDTLFVCGCVLLINCSTKHTRSCFIHVRKIDLELFRRARAAKRAKGSTPRWGNPRFARIPRIPRSSQAVSLLVCRHRRREKVLFDQRGS